MNVDPALDLIFSENSSASDYRVMSALPLFAEDRLIGVVSLYSSQISSFQDEHIRLLETISHIAADAINAAVHHAEAEAYAITDALTGLPNSRSLRMQFDKEVVRASRSGKGFQLVVMDLDGFKAVNDTHGHKLGDTMLKSIGGVIGEQLREYDFLARYGGDEFVAIIPESDIAHTESLHERIEEAVSRFMLKGSNGQMAGVGISLGSANYPDNGESLDTLIETADKAMYLVKKRNRLIRLPEPRQLPEHQEFDANGYEFVPVKHVEEVQVLAAAAVN